MDTTHFGTKRVLFMMVYIGDEIGNELTSAYSWACLGTSGLKKNPNAQNTSVAHAFTFTWISYHKCYSMSYLAVREKTQEINGLDNKNDILKI